MKLKLEIRKERKVDVTNWTVKELEEWGRLRKDIRGLVFEGQTKLYAIID